MKRMEKEITQCNLPPKKRADKEVTQCNPPPTKTADIFYLSNFDGISISLKPQRLPLSVGRHLNNDLIINNGCVSRWHCSLELNHRNKIVIKDLATRNGTIVGERIIQNEAVELEEEMFIHIGGVVFQAFKIPENKEFHDFSKNINQENSQHGICVVDLCNSTQIDRKKLDSIMHRIRF